MVRWPAALSEDISWDTTVSGGGSLRLRLRLVSGVAELEETLTVAVEVEADHATGRFFYSASDISFELQDLTAFAERLLVVPGDRNEKAVLSDLASYFVLTVWKGAMGFEAELRAEEPLIGSGGALTVKARVPDAFVPEARRAALSLLEPA